MVVITKTKLILFYETEPMAKEPILKWYTTVLISDWSDFNTIKQSYNSVGYIGNDRYVFNVSGNKYRIVAMIHFSKRTLYLRLLTNNMTK